MVIIVVVVMMMSYITDQKRGRRKTKTEGFRVRENILFFGDGW